MFDGILCFLHLPHRLALTWKSFHWNELDTGVHLKQEWIFRGVQQIVVWVWLVCVPGLFLSPFYYNLGAQLSVQSSTQNHIVIWMRVNVKCQHLFAFAFSLSSTRSSRYVVSLISIALIHLQILLLSSFPCLDGPKNMLNHTFLLSLVTLRCRCNFTST